MFWFIVAVAQPTAAGWLATLARGGRRQAPKPRECVRVSVSVLDHTRR